MEKLRQSLQSRLFRPASRKVWIWVGLLAVLLGLRLALPSLLKGYLNRQLSRSMEYRGHIEGIDIHLWRGAYRIREIKIEKSSGAVREPLFQAAKIDLSIQWKEIFHGSLVGEVELEQPRVSFVTGPTPAESQSGKGEPWNRVIENFFPFKLNKVKINEGQIHFQNHHSTPPVDIFMDQLFVVATNLTNTRATPGELPAGVLAYGQTLGNGGVTLELHFSPWAAAPTFELVAALTNVNLTALNDFLRAYGKFDVERGVFALYTSTAAKQGRYEGYLKVFFDDLDVFEWKKERGKNVLQIFWQTIVGGVTTVFKNHPNDQLATKVPISGNFEKTDIGTWGAVGSLLRNAFIQALLPKIDEAKKVEELPPEKK